MIKQQSNLSICLAMALVAFVVGPVAAQTVPAQPTIEPSVPWLSINEPAWLEDKLNAAVSLEFENVTLAEAAATISRQHGVPVVLDFEAIEQAEIPLEARLTYHCQEQPLRQALAEIAAQYELVCRLGALGIAFTSAQKASNDLITRAYPVLDLLVRAEDQVPRVCWSGPYKGEWDGDSLVDIIGSTIDPTSWDEVGGVGSAVFYTSQGTLMVSQTVENHAKLEQLFASLRQAHAWSRAAQPVEDPTALVLRVYQVYSASGDHEQQQAHSNELAEAIETMIEPASWQAGGGDGNVRAFGGALFVRATPAVQAQVRSLFNYQEGLWVLSGNLSLPGN